MRRGLKAELLEEVLHFLIQEKELLVRYCDHQLTAFKYFQGVREWSYPSRLAFGL